MEARETQHSRHSISMCYIEAELIALYLIKPRIISLTRADPLFFLPTAPIFYNFPSLLLLLADKTEFLRSFPLSLFSLILMVGQKLVVSPDFLPHTYATLFLHVVFFSKKCPRSFVFPQENPFVTRRISLFYLSLSPYFFPSTIDPTRKDNRAFPNNSLKRLTPSSRFNSTKPRPLSLKDARTNRLFFLDESRQRVFGRV